MFISTHGHCIHPSSTYIIITIIDIIIIIIIRNIEFPSAVPPFPDGAPSADVHLRNVFYRLGLNNRETVALCGAHTIGMSSS